jgi:HK97 family phage major capsid protein
MKTMYALIAFIVGAFAIFQITKPATVTNTRPPTNAATQFLSNAWRITCQLFAVALIRIDEFCGQWHFGRAILGLGLTMEEKIEKSLEALNGKLGKVEEVEKSLGEQKTAVEKINTALSELQQKLLDHQKTMLSQLSPEARVRKSGRVTDACAKYYASAFILHCEKSNMLEGLASEPTRQKSLVEVARGFLGITGKTAISVSDIPLPVQYGSEIKELTSEFGVVRSRMSPYPIGMGTAKPPRMGTRPAFGSIAMSASFTEKSPTITFAALESHKIGGLVRLPREIDEQSIVPMGQYLARYGAIEFARAEDTWGFLADGTGTYENVSGVVKIATDNSKSVVLAAATGPQDATLADFRAMRTKVNKACLSGKRSAYYLDSTWETRLPTFKTEADPFAYVRNADGSATLDGYPIVWTDVLEPYAAADVVSKPLALFGALDYWWMGEHGAPRIDTSEHVFFANDQLAVRFIEEIDFDYAALDAMSVLLTGAAS